MKIRKLNPKMGFWRAKHGLSKHGNLKTKIGLIWEERTKREGGGEEKKKGRRWRSQDQASQGMELWIIVWMLDFGMNFVWNSQVLCEGPCTCMARSLPQTYGC